VLLGATFVILKRVFKCKRIYPNKTIEKVISMEEKVKITTGSTVPNHEIVEVLGLIWGLFYQSKTHR
jgi:hypothetical protein